MDAYRRPMASTLAERIKEARKRRRLSQGGLARLIGLKSGVGVSHWETGVRTPLPETVKLLAEKLGVRYEDLDPDNEAYDREAPRNKTVRKVTVDALESRPHAMADQEAPDTKDGAMGGDNRTLLLDQLTATAKRLPLKALQAVVDLALEKDLARRRSPRALPKNRLA